MSLSAAVLQKMLDKGLTLADVVEIAEVWEEGAAQPIPTLDPREAKRAADRERMRLKREAEKVARQSRDSRGDIAATSGDKDARLTCERTQVVKPSSSLRSEDVVVVAERERAPQTDDWPKGNGPHLAKLLVAEVASHWLDLDRSGGLNTSTGRFLVWKRDGASWVHDVVPVVSTACAKRKSRINSWQFFDEAIAASIAANRAALEIPEANRVVPLRPGGVTSIADREAAIRAEARRLALES